MTFLTMGVFFCCCINLDKTALEGEVSCRFIGLSLSRFSGACNWTADSTNHGHFTFSKHCSLLE